MNYFYFYPPSKKTEEFRDDPKLGIFFYTNRFRATLHANEDLHLIIMDNN